ncbi:hypothetical protein MPL3356_80032 [Mesorhizobium plurifarium]|uniref:Uncharacterized protein n=1 Tax=Mesorhizobium plurifarium TaxID=69974 RepID=A0A090ED26_MESPL|nr:hypothetical protein MPL3356_80032 [Mesorhizobium plurifarium]
MAASVAGVQSLNFTRDYNRDIIYP